MVKVLIRMSVSDIIVPGFESWLHSQFWLLANTDLEEDGLIDHANGFLPSTYET